MLHMPLNSVTEADIVSLVAAGQWREGGSLDFKRDFEIRSDEQKREFLADVSAFANSQGGDLIFGIAEVGGVATELVGIELQDSDAEILRLENILRSGMEPRIPTVSIRWISLGPARGILIVRALRSWNGPHRVMANNRFFARNSAGKYPMDVSELRSSFLAAEGVIARIRRFRDERVSMIATGQSPIGLGAKHPRMVLHVLPISAFLTPLSLPPEGRSQWFQPLTISGGWSQRHTLEGFLTYMDSEGEAYDASYALTFRTGAVEAVGNLGRRDPEHGDFVFLEEAEATLCDKYLTYRDGLLGLGASAPLAVFVTLVDVAGTRNYVNPRFYASRRTPLFRQDMVFLPEVLVEQPSERAFEDIGSVINSMWQTFGYARSPYHDADGHPIQR